LGAFLFTFVAMVALGLISKIDLQNTKKLMLEVLQSDINDEKKK
jgi:hypothetical protein